MLLVSGKIFFITIGNLSIVFALSGIVSEFIRSSENESVIVQICGIH
jgi:hypothetical protein